MNMERKSGTSLILADGYSYTELIPCPDARLDGGFIRIFHAFFNADEEVAAPVVDGPRPPFASSNDPDGAGP